MRDRLIELLENVPFNPFDQMNIENNLNRIIDVLLENGVIVPPFHIGQELWDIHYNKPRKWKVVYLGYNGKEWHANIHWFKNRHNFKTMSITYPFLGKMWYLTKEEAEQALKGGEG